MPGVKAWKKSGHNNMTRPDYPERKDNTIRLVFHAQDKITSPINSVQIWQHSTDTDRLFDLSKIASVPFFWRPQRSVTLRDEQQSFLLRVYGSCTELSLFCLRSRRESQATESFWKRVALLLKWDANLMLFLQRTEWEQIAESSPQCISTSS